VTVTLLTLSMLGPSCGGGSAARDDAGADGRAGDGGVMGEGGSGDDAQTDATPPTARLELPAAVALPYVVAGAGGSSVTVLLRNTGGATARGPGGGDLVWRLAGDAALSLGTGPATVAAGASVSLTVSFTGAATETRARATLTLESEQGSQSVPVHAVAGDPGIGATAWETVSGPGGVRWGEGVTVSLPTAPYPTAGGSWTDDHVRIFVPAGYRDVGAHDLVVHFHGHNTTLAATLAAHKYEGHLFASGQNAILVVPQGPVNAASGDFGKLMHEGGLAALVQQVLVVLFRDGRLEQPVTGEVVLTSHSGGYHAVALNLGGTQPFPIVQVGLFDSLYGDVDVYRGYVTAGGRLFSNYSAGGGTLTNNEALAAQLEGDGVAVSRAATLVALGTSPAIVAYADTTHEGTTRVDGVYGEQLRFGLRRSRRGPRVELRAATASAGSATVRWLAPREADLEGFRVELSADGVAWTTAASVGPSVDRATFAFAAGARVRVVPAVNGVPPGDALASDVYRLDPDAQVLVVDGFDRVLDGSWGGLAHDFAAVVSEAAGAVHTVSHRAVIEDGFDLAPYRVAVWLLGDESTADLTFSPEEQTAVTDYLAGGGGLLVSGSEVAYDLGHAGSGAAFLASALGAVFDADDSNSYSVTGEGPLVGLGPFGYGGVGAPYVEDYPDALLTAAGASVLLRYGSGKVAAVGNRGGGALVGLPLELMDRSADRTALVGALVTFVGD
jgi:hypothetical protein